MAVLKSIASTGLSFLLALVFAAGCNKKPGPKSQTTTRTQTTTENAEGNTTSSDVTETKTEQSDGTTDVERTETTKHSTPPP